MTKRDCLPRKFLSHWADFALARKILHQLVTDQVQYVQ